MDEDRKSELLRLIASLPATPMSAQQANTLLSEALELFLADGYAGMESTPNSRFMQEFMDNHSKIPQLY